MAETKIIVVDYDHNGLTGHISIKVKCQTTDGNATWDGPVMQYGIDALGFRHRFNSDIKQFENWVISEHRANEGAHQVLTQALLERKGRVIG